MEKIGFFEELQPNGQIAKSSTRWAFVVMVCFASLVTAYMTYKQQIDLGLIGLLYGYAFVGKGYQKFIELQKSPTEIKEEAPK
jgi:hypothetical protein